MIWILSFLFSVQAQAIDNPMPQLIEKSVFDSMSAEQKSECVFSLPSTVRRMARTQRAVLSSRDRRFRSEVGDKFLHCSVSCHLTNKCGSTISSLVGWLKELIDQVSGTGNAEADDIRANNEGISYAQSGRTCNSTCFAYAESLR